MNLEEMKKSRNTWRAFAIVFMILLALLILWIVVVTNNVLKDWEKEDVCVYNICADEMYDAYDYFEGVCDCYVDNMIVHTEYVP